MLSLEMLKKKKIEVRKNMKLHKFGVKLFFDVNRNYSSKAFIPVFHTWIQDELVEDHLLIDVADYSHIPDGPGIMLIAHEGHFSLDQEKYQPGIMYMRKTKIECEFIERFNQVLSITIEAANRLRNFDIINDINFISNSFRFIANDRLYAENTIDNQHLYKEKIQKAINNKYPDRKIEFEDASDAKERMAFTVRFSDEINILE